MTALMTYLREFHFGSVAFRLVLAMISGSVIGAGRARKRRNAGFRTYTLTCIGAALALIISQYEYAMMLGPWAGIVAEVGMKFDASRFAASVISGIGFLAAGTILSAEHQQVSGLTTATGLFASVCMGLACGAGFYEVVIPSIFVLILVLDVMYPLEVRFKRRVRNINIFVEFDTIKDLNVITDAIRAKSATVYEIDVERMLREGKKYPSAIMTLKLSRENYSHSAILSSVAELPCVFAVKELIS